MDKPSRRTPGRKRQPLSAERIASAGLALIDAAGLDGFSFRALAARLGCEAMSLYHYFPSKAHLFDAMIGIYLAEMTLLPESAPWPARLRHICGEFRDAALRHPGFFQFVSVYRMNSRAGLSFLDHVLRAFEATGLGTEARARHFRIVGYYITGAALDEALGYAKGPSAAQPVPVADAARDFPSIIGVGAYFGAEHHRKTFETGLEILIAAIAADVAALERQPRRPAIP